MGSSLEACVGAVSDEINSKFEAVAVKCGCSSAQVAKFDDQVSEFVRQLPRLRHLSGTASVLQQDVRDLRLHVGALSDFSQELSDRFQPLYPMFDRALASRVLVAGLVLAFRGTASPPAHMFIAFVNDRVFFSFPFIVSQAACFFSWLFLVLGHT